MAGPLRDHFHEGDGEPLLVIHGFTATWRTWGAVPAALARHFEVLAPTLPGHTGGPPLEGRPSIDGLADWLEAVLDAEGWADAHVAGFSLGGWLALELGKRGRARTVIPIAPGGAQGRVGERETKRIERLFRLDRATATVSLPVLDRLVRRPRFRRIAMRRMMVDASKMSPREADGTVRAFVATPAFDALLRELTVSDGLDGLDRVRAPVRLVWGERDQVLPIEHARFFREALPEAEFQVIPRAGHVPFWDAPEAVAEAIRAGARSSAPAPAAG